ncbi:hypothetical protein CONPUDRAFT_167101 [Coniophora puteana RWD-64-598 SS2]|uniref:Uncharacterized protein n=1 Tax=Coniophora puteana (strain RWD-64-598) TaxID=741705 RepID=A0A5M3ML93_CONPW|nr:uncharacterized protein CONPUDRAFT_167101 [Coniophora puteana RWD-64-598 SS2]EIW79341.1 hypothetical protein CONPUDRAFT_167101 [Coniophora puteana RWD-64-598 SS2]
MSAFASSSSSSSSDGSAWHSGPQPSSSASRFLYSMRRSLGHVSPKKRHQSEDLRSMYSTSAERSFHPPPPSYRYGAQSTSVSIPTVEQIAMGLHISRTPHLRPSGSPHQRHSAPSIPSRHAHAHETAYRPHPIPLPPPPSRSSLKKTSTNGVISTPPKAAAMLGASPSTSTIGSTGPATPVSARSSRLKMRMSKFIFGYRQSGSSTNVSSLVSSGSEGMSAVPPRKAVRFSTSVITLGDGVEP